MSLTTGSDVSRFVFSIGHSDLGEAYFLRLLRINEIDLILDVRSAPYSRRAPQYNRSALARSLELARIAYVFAGKSLGGRPPDPTLYVSGRVNYPRVASSRIFVQGLRRLSRLLAQHRVALLCSERDPLECHRFLLIGRALTIRGVNVEHILSDGSLESQPQGESRLVEMAGLTETISLDNSREILARAYALQESRFAFREPQRADSEDWQLSF
jgi:uncharacterized protein (DUF488 family)